MPLLDTLGLRVVESLFAVEEVKEEKEIQIPRTLWERFFDPDPTRPLWQKTRPEIIMVVTHKPAMYKLMNQFVIHPSLMPGLMDAINKQNESSKVFRW